MRYYAEITTKVIYETDTEKMDDIKEEIRNELEAGIKNSALTDWENNRKVKGLCFVNIENLWSYACSGNLEKLKKYFENGGEVNRRYSKFNQEHSLIAGAYRNKQHNTVNFLLSVGETITLEEAEEFREYLDKFGKM